MFAIIAAVLFAVAFILDLVGSAGGDHINPETLTADGLTCAALHLTGAASWSWAGRVAVVEPAAKNVNHIYP